MGRNRRLQLAGLYHVTTRSNAEEVICLDAGDYSALLTLIAASGLLCHMFCLMPPHYHVLASVEEGELSDSVYRINRLYASAFNRRYGRRGHVFDSPFSATRVETEEYLYNAVCYIALNPPHPEEWQWSSYPGLLGLREPFGFVDSRLVLDAFGSVASLRERVQAAAQRAARDAA